MKKYNFKKQLLLLLFLPIFITAETIRLGIYSGTFDPPTKAHNAVIRASLEKLRLDKLYIFVNVNGVKNCKCSSKERIQMLERMLSDIKGKVVIIAQQSNNKRADYLLVKKILDEKIIQITGEDSYARRLLIIPENRVQFDAIAIIPRGTEKQINTESLEKKAFYLDVNINAHNTSSTEVRKKISVNDFKDIDVEPEVLSYIVEHGLYRNNTKTYNPSKKRKKFEQKYYNYVGKIFCPHEPPAFDETTSEKAWQELFYKWIYIKKGMLNA